MKVSEMKYAKRKAMQIFDEWLEITGVIDRHSGHYDELSGIIEDAVEIGSMTALGIDFSIVDGELVHTAEKE